MLDLPNKILALLQYLEVDISKHNVPIKVSVLTYNNLSDLINSIIYSTEYNSYGVSNLGFYCKILTDSELEEFKRILDGEDFYVDSVVYVDKIAYNIINIE